MTTETPVDIGTLIWSKPGMKGGRPCLAGTEMTVHAVAARHIPGMSAEEILDQFPDLDLARIHAALAYYFANKKRIEDELDADEQWGAEMAKRFPHGLKGQPVPQDMLDRLGVSHPD